MKSKSGKIQRLRTKNDKSFSEFRKIYLLYLEKIEKLTDRERNCYADYFEHISKPQYKIDISHIKDMFSNVISVDYNNE